MNAVGGTKMVDFGLLFDGVLGVFATVGFCIFVYWWARYRRATVVYIYVTVLLLGIGVEKWIEFFFRITFLEIIKQETSAFCIILGSSGWQFRGLLLTIIVIMLVTHMSARMVKTIMGVRKLKEQIKKDDMVGYASTILVVEDDEQIPGILKTYFEKYYQNMKMELATSGEEALEILNTNQQIAVFILDIHLRGRMDGFELCRRIRDRVPWGIIIGITGFPSQYPLSDARAHGFDDYFIKPFRLTDMDQALKCHIERMQRWGKIRQRKPPTAIY